MKRKLVVLSVLVLMGGPAALAQNGKSTVAPAASSPLSTIPEAPIGHRQPRASDFPDERKLNDPNAPVNREDAALDKKIKSICRGC
jgi:hypothetical protein